MHYRTLETSLKKEITDLFTSVFTSSEGENEGKLVGKLALELASHIDNEDIIGFGAYENDALIGAIFFTRLHFAAPLQVYMLAPVAVHTEHQGKGVGQGLINYGLNQLKKRSVEFVTTYGDPAFYSRVGFQTLSESVIQAPLKLSMPQGWLGQSLTGGEIPAIKQRPTCVKEFDDPAYW
jgi:predicted N-acetyltransferase YhbS